MSNDRRKRTSTNDRIVHEIVYPHPIWNVWQALTTSEALAQWLMPNDFVPQMGHHFTFRVGQQEGWSGVMECQVVALDAPHRLAFTQRGDPQMPTTLVVFTLEQVGQHTRLRLEHSGFAAGGAAGEQLRDLLDSGWGSKKLREQLPRLLDQLATAS